MRILIGWLGRSLSYLLFYGPASVRRSIAFFLAFLWFDVLRIRRSIVLDNLHLAFPELSRSERIRLGRKNLQHLGLNLVEYCYLPWLNKDNYQRYFAFENSQLLDETLAKGKGALLLTLHLGHGDLACAGMSLHGWQVVMVSKFFKFKWLNDLWFGMRERLGTRFVAPRDSSYSLLKALRNGAAVVIPLDQFTGPPIGVRTTFFNHETGTAAGLAVMAARSGTPILAVYTVRNRQGRHELHFVREIQIDHMRDPQSVTRSTQAFNDELEKFVRLHPEQWMWIHRRWKEFVV